MLSLDPLPLLLFTLILEAQRIRGLGGAIAELRDLPASKLIP